MADFTLTSGRELSFDLGKISIKEWQSLRSPAYSTDADNAVISKITGMKVDEIEDMPADDFNRLTFAMFKKMREPLSDPN